MRKEFRYLIFIFLFLIFLKILGVIIFLKIRKNNRESFENQYIYEFPNFLSNDECNLIINLSKPKLQSSYVYSGNRDKKDEDSRISTQAWCYDRENKIFRKISEKVSILLGLPLNYQEALQVVRYQPGGFFRSHYDTCIGTKDYCYNMNRRGGNRYATILIYLNDVEDGGETCFTKLKRCIKPEKGKAVLFFNTDKKGNLNFLSEHSANPVKKGEKWICNKWVHLEEYI